MTDKQPTMTELVYKFYKRNRWGQKKNQTITGCFCLAGAAAATVPDGEGFSRKDPNMLSRKGLEARLQLCKELGITGSLGLECWNDRVLQSKEKVMARLRETLEKQRVAA
jgi:hypothetical protein